MEAMPLNANGKVDRKRLPEVERREGEERNKEERPRTMVEEVMARIWGEVLRVEEVGIYENFFELGGHSLLATQIIARVREAYQVEMPLRTLFERPTVATLSEWIESNVDMKAEKISDLIEALGHISSDEAKTLLEDNSY
jgi:acyl carrier protein